MVNLANIDFNSPEWKEVEKKIAAHSEVAKAWTQRRYLELAPIVDANRYYHPEDITDLVLARYLELRKEGKRDLKADPWYRDEEEIGLMAATARWIVHQRIEDLQRSAAEAQGFDYDKLKRKS